MRRNILLGILAVVVMIFFMSDTGEKHTQIIYPVNNIFLSDSIGDNNNYLELIKAIEVAPEKSTIKLHLAGYGGNLDTTVHLINAIERSKANVEIVVEGPVYSAHAFLSMVGNKREISANSLLMFHLPAVSINGEYVSDTNVICSGEKEKKDRGQSAYTKCINQMNTLNKVFDRIVSRYVYPYLTKSEIEDYKAGKDVYVDGIEMQRRINHGL